MLTDLEFYELRYSGRAATLVRGFRAVYLGLGQARGKHCDVLAVRGALASVRFDSGAACLALAKDCHPIPRRPPPDF